MDLRGSRSHAVYAVAIHRGSPSENSLNEFRSRFLALAEVESLRDEIGDHTIRRACVEKGVGAGRFATEAEFDVPDHNEVPRRAGDASFAWSRRLSHRQRMKAGSSLSSGMDHVV